MRTVIDTRALAHQLSQRTGAEIGVWAMSYSGVADEYEMAIVREEGEGFVRIATAKLPGQRVRIAENAGDARFIANVLFEAYENATLGERYLKRPRPRLCAGMRHSRRRAY